MLLRPLGSERFFVWLLRPIGRDLLKVLRPVGLDPLKLFRPVGSEKLPRPAGLEKVVSPGWLMQIIIVLCDTIASVKSALPYWLHIGCVSIPRAQV